MILFRRKQKEIRNINSIIQAVRKNNFSERCCLFILGVYISNLAFNLFFAPYNVVTGGSTGLSIIVENIWGIDKSIFVFLFSLVILILSYFTLVK